MALTTCCGICSLKTGTTIQGIMSMLFTMMTFVIAIIEITQLDNGVNLDFRRESYITIKCLISTCTAFLVMMLAITLMLLMGTKNRRAHFVFPYLCIQLTDIFMSIAICVGSVVLLTYPSNIPTSTALSALLIMGMMTAFKIYCWLVVYHFYQELLLEKYGRKVNPNTGKIFQEPFEHDI